MEQHTVTSGSITKQLTHLALPLLLGNILQQLYNMIDALILGWFNGSDAFGAAGIGGTVMNLFLFILTGACTGVCVILSYLYGKDDLKTFHREFFHAVFFGGLFTIFISIGFIFLSEPLLRLIQTPDSLIGLTSSYLHIILGGLIVCFANNLLAAVLRAVGNTLATLIFLGISIFTNLLLDIWFVAGLSLGISGAAWATILSQFIAAALSGIHLKIKYPQLMIHREDLRVDPALLMQTIRFASASALQQASIYIGKLLVQSVVNRLGTASINAYTAATRIEAFANSFGDSGSAAESVFIGQNTGAGNYKRAENGFRNGFRMMAALGMVMALLLFLSASPLCRLALPKDNLSSLSPAVYYLRVVAFFYPLCFIGCANVGYFQGTGHIHVPAVCSALQLSLRVILSWFLTRRMGLAGVALATGAGWALAVSMHLFARKFYSAPSL